MADLLYCVELIDGTTRRTCWVDKKVTEGQRITLKDSEQPDRLWTVTLVHEHTHLKTRIRRGWNVGGL